MNRIEKIKRWLNYGVKNILQKLANKYVYSVLGVKVKLNVQLGIGNESYNVHDSVVVSLSEDEANSLPKEDLMRILKFKLYHECSHYLFSDEAEWNDAVYALAEEINNYAESEFSTTGLLLLQEDLTTSCHFLLNMLEDGRIENLLCNIYPGAKKHRDWYRLIEWTNAVIPENSTNFRDIQSAILRISTMGILPNGFLEKYHEGTEIYEVVMKLVKPISDFVRANTIEDGKNSVVQVGKLIAPYFLQNYGITEDEYKNLTEQAKRAGKKPVSKEELLEIAKQVAEQCRNNKGAAKDIPGAKLPNNGPAISVLQDGAENKNDESGQGETPDLVVDLRKNPPEVEEAEDDNEENPYYYRPKDLPQPQPKQNTGSGSAGDDKSQGEDTPEGNTGSGSAGDDKSQGEDTPEGNTGSGSAGDDKSNGKDTPEGNTGSEDAGSDKSQGEDIPEGNTGSGSAGDDKSQGEDTPEGNTGSGSAGDDKSNGKDTPEGNTGSEDAGSDKSQGEDTPEGNTGSEDTGSNEEESGRSRNSSDTYSLPVERDFREAVKSALDKAVDDLEQETEADIKRANKTEKEWEKSSINEAFPFTTESVNCLAKEFGGSDVSILDYRINSKKVKCEDDITQRGKRLAAKIRQIINKKVIKDKKDARFGLVDSQNLGKFITGQQDFYKQDGRKVKSDIACLILKDDSGSMSGENELRAMEVLAELEVTFKELNFPLRLQAFSHRGSETMKIIKSWDDKDPNRSYSWGFHSRSTPNGSNNDAYSIALATDILSMRKERNKLLIVVSDGAPCCSTELVKKAVCRAQSAGIFVISILIGNEKNVTNNWNVFTSMYGKYLLSGSLETMGNQLFRFLKQFVANIRQ